MRMSGRLCKDILNDPFRQFSGALVLFLNNLDPGSSFNIRSVSSTHFWLLLVESDFFTADTENAELCFFKKLATPVKCTLAS